MRRLHLCWRVAVFVLLCCCIPAAWAEPPRRQALLFGHQRDAAPSPVSPALSRRPLILMHDKFFGRDFVSVNYTFADCPVRCTLTANRSYESRAAAVFWHSVWTDRMTEAPFNTTSPRLYPHAVWVWAAAEAPGNWNRLPNASAGLFPPDPALDRMFNLSMTFRRDSDVAFPYGGTRPAAAASADAVAAFEAQTRAWFQGKSRLAAWTVSHCFTASRREEYVAALRPFARVDVFGKCSGLWGIVRGAGHERHAAMIRDKYKFYLAFENRLCRDYVTEKFWIDALLNGAIPVVRGGMGDGDYAALAPPGSYVNTEWFTSPAQLAAHLRAVASNYTLFRGYHTWRLTHDLVSKDVYWHKNQVTERGAMCNLCTWLHAHQHAMPSSTLNLTRFWDGSTHCRPPQDVPDRRLLKLPDKLEDNEQMTLAWQG